MTPDWPVLIFAVVAALFLPSVIQHHVRAKRVRAYLADVDQ